MKKIFLTFGIALLGFTAAFAQDADIYQPTETETEATETEAVESEATESDAVESEAAQPDAVGTETPEATENENDAIKSEEEMEAKPEDSTEPIEE